jgi:two-component system, chemotaxis family, response regulator Rcp1
MTSKTRIRILDRPVEVLLIEDNPGDVRLFLEEVKEMDAPSNIHVVDNGIDALKFLKREKEYIKAPKPDLIVLDMYIPLKSGFDVLTEMGNDRELSELPIVIFSSVPIDRDSIENINNFIVLSKPDNLERFDNVINKVEEFLLMKY